MRQLLMVWNGIPNQFNSFYHFGGHLGGHIGFSFIYTLLTVLIDHCFYKKNFLYNYTNMGHTILKSWNGAILDAILNFSKCSMMPVGHHSDSPKTTHSLTE